MSFSTDAEPRVTAVAISGSPSGRSKSRRLLSAAVQSLRLHGVEPIEIDLAALSAEALLGRYRSEAVDLALASTTAARIVVASTPVYRASYSGLLKIFFDLLAPDSLSRAVAVPIATGGAPGHQLMLDYALRPLFGSLGAIVVPTGIYGTDAQFTLACEPLPALLERVDRAVVEALTIAGAASPSLTTTTSER
jgi:FMN reductase